MCSIVVAPSSRGCKMKNDPWNIKINPPLGDNMKSNFVCMAHSNINQRMLMSGSYASSIVLWHLSNQNSMNEFNFLNVTIWSHRYTVIICQSLRLKKKKNLKNANQMHVTQINYNFFPKNVRQVQCLRRGSVLSTELSCLLAVSLPES